MSALAAIGRRHSVVITALRSDHSTYTVDGNVSNHSAGRAKANEENAARAHALRLVAAALDELGLTALVPDLEVGAVVGRRCWRADHTRPTQRQRLTTGP